MSRVPQPIAERFWAKVNKTSDCWLWTGAPQKDGYGVLWTKDGRVMAHRFSWEMANGESFPQEKLACHTCDVPACVNPNHIYPGTRISNAHDALLRHEEWLGEKNSQARLSREQIKEIRSLRLIGCTYAKLAELFGVSQRHARNIVANKRWKVTA